MYGKHFASMYTGSMVGSGIAVFAVWGYVLANMHVSQEGGANVELNPKLLAAILGGDERAIEDAIEFLCTPDPRSRTKDEDGCRLVREGQFLYRVVNALRYNAIRNEVERAEYMRRYMRERYHKEKEKKNPNVKKANTVLTKPDLNVKNVKTLATLAHTYTDTDIKTTLSGTSCADGVGFGKASKKEKPTEFDIATAKALEAAVRKLPPRRTFIATARPSTWPPHIQALRLKDQIPEEDITTGLKWYAAHIGEEYTPHAYSGLAFRQKWPKIWAAASKEATATVTVTPQATKIAERVVGLGWPKGSVENLPGFVQLCLSAYTAWAQRAVAFVAKLRANNLAAHHDEKERRTLLRFGERVLEIKPDPGHFVDQWVRDVHSRVRTWAAWDGTFKQYLYSPNCKRFTAMGRGWAMQYCNDAARWDRFTEVMGKEVPE